MSQDDRAVLNVWNKSTVLTNDGHYEVEIPFKRLPSELPNNRSMAEKRLVYLGRRLSKDPVLYGKYKAGIEDLLKSGYAEPVPDDEVNDCSFQWYLPHHNVVNPNKPEKFRIVFDCAAEYAGTSLNKEVFRGPDLTNNLIGVLLRFREAPVAVMGDVKEMFHQVQVKKEHRDALRFLSPPVWWSMVSQLCQLHITAYRQGAPKRVR